MRAMVLDAPRTPLRAAELAPPQVPVRTTVEAVPLERANEALERLRAGS